MIIFLLILLFITILLTAAILTSLGETSRAWTLPAMLCTLIAGLAIASVICVNLQGAFAGT